VNERRDRVHNLTVGPARKPPRYLAYCTSLLRNSRRLGDIVASIARGPPIPRILLSHSPLILRMRPEMRLS